MSIAAVVRVVLVAALVGATLVLWSENRRMKLTRGRVAAVASQAERDLEAQIRQLEHQLRQAIESRETLLATIDERVAELVELRKARADRLRRATKPPPEGVRLALLAINDQLRADGYPIRFLHAERIEDRELGAVEFSEYRPEWFSTAFYAADRVRFELDRTTETLTLRGFDGRVFSLDVERALGDEGETIVLRSVDVEAWESRLPFLVRATGVRPAEAAIARARPTIDAGTARVWAERLDNLLELAETELDFRVARVKDLRDGRFMDVLVHGYDERRHLAASGKAATLEVRVDDEANTAELVLRNGTWRRPAGVTDVGETGFRILLPAVDARTARSTMLGMVVTE